MVIEVETENQLRQYQLEDYLGLLSDPIRLIEELYIKMIGVAIAGKEIALTCMSDAVLTLLPSIDPEKLPLHDITNFIAKKYDIEIEPIRLGLIEVIRYHRYVHR